MNEPNKYPNGKSLEEQLENEFRNSNVYQALNKAGDVIGQAVNSGINRAQQEINRSVNGTPNNNGRPTPPPYYTPPQKPYYTPPQKPYYTQPGTPPPKTSYTPPVNVKYYTPNAGYQPPKKPGKKKQKYKPSPVPGILATATFMVGLLGIISSGSFGLFPILFSGIAASIVFNIFKGIFKGTPIEEDDQPRQTVPAQPVQQTPPPVPKAEPKKPAPAKESIKPFPRSGDPEADKVIGEGEKYMEQLHQADVDIPDEGVSECIRRMETTGRKIFEYIAQNPSKAGQIRKFMSYYLPTTLKLLKTYDRMGRQGVKGENITNTMYDIEGMMQTIAVAFDKQLDSLFEAEAMDVSTDITVLESMLKQEGYLDEKEFKADETAEK